jgi:phosphohistidine phosphatase SixA
MTLLLIRHAHAGSRKDWAGNDGLRPLSAKGLRQAAALPALLRPWVPSRVLSSPALRCSQTVQPLADRLRVKIEEAEELAEGANGEAVELVRSLTDARVAMCTHGDVILEILVALADEDHLDLGPAPRQAKGSVWVLEAKRGRFLKAKYIPPKS